MKTNVIHNEDCLTGMRKLPNESVNSCITSPPYYGLRSYDAPDMIFGGSKGCEHEWGIKGKPHHPGQVQDNKAVHNQNAIGQTIGSGKVCHLCNAWFGHLGLEPSPRLYVEHLVEIFREVRRVFRKDGTCWIVIGDSYAGSGQGAANYPGNYPKQNSNVGSLGVKGRAGEVPQGLKPKDLMGIPWRAAFALQSDGWYLRSDIIWHKPNPMPESVTDRPTKSHEYIFLLTKSAKYWYDADAIAEKANYDGRKDEMMKGSEKYRDSVVPGQEAPTFALRGHKRWRKDEDGKRIRNKRSVWTVPTKPYPEAHFAVYSPELIEPCVLAGCPEWLCKKCGTPRVRIINRYVKFESGSGKAGNKPKGKMAGGIQTESGEYDIRMGPVVEKKTIGWTDCECGAGWQGGIVIDPFMGSGTTAQVAYKHGRRYIGYEISPEYCKLAEKRLAQTDLVGEGY